MERFVPGSALVFGPPILPAVMGVALALAAGLWIGRAKAAPR